MTNRSSWSNLSRPVRERLRAAVLERDGYRCRLELPGCTTIATTADHLAPRDIAGDGLTNLQAACRNCNLAKGDPKRHDPEPITRAWWND